MKSLCQRTCAAVVLGACLLVPILAGPPALAQECEIPLFVQQSLVGANLMVLVDNSTSMNTGVYDLDYDKNVVYTGNFLTAATYYVNHDGNYSPKSFNLTWPATPVLPLVCSDNGMDGMYPGNYLNWAYFHATATELADFPEWTRIQLLKDVLADVLSRSTRLRIGLTVFYPGGEDGNILAYCEGGNELAVVGVIDAMIANANTQLGEAMETIGDYFKETQEIAGAASAVIQYPCQYNFCLVVTDGLPTMDLGVSAYLQDADGDGKDPGDCASIGSPYPNTMQCSDYFDDVCYALAHDDLRPDMEGDQLLYTYVVGFHENGQLLQEAADNGDGLFFFAENYEGLVRSIDYAIQDILRRISGGSAVAVVSTERGDDDRLYRGKFMPLDWDGYLECFRMPYDESEPPLWEAGGILQSRDPADRDLFTAIGSTRHAFDDGSASVLQAALGAASEEEAADLINWARGFEVAGLRDRHGWVLGDLVHSTPVVVAAPSTFTPIQSYQDFVTANQDRRKMVYVGANDGMLHAFDAIDGEEVWGFVPEFALPDIPAMADSFYCHLYTCDQTPTVKDIQVDGVWKTLLITNGREGGAGVFALDITDPDSPEVLWQKTLLNNKSYPSEVEIVSIGGQATALVGSGLDEDTQKAYLYSYDIDSGTLLGTLTLGSPKYRNKATKPVVVDLNFDGQADLLYVADLAGNLWRARLNDDPRPSAWSVSLLYTGDQEITADPVAAYGENGAIMVYFGTGAYLTEDDMMTLDPQRFICIIDNHAGTTYDYKDLANQTTTINSLVGKAGWYVDLWQGDGERVTEQALVIAETVIFTSFVPSMNACVAGGESWLYQLAYDTGGLAPESDSDATLEDRAVSLGEGIASYPVVDLAHGTVVVQSSDASISVEKIASVYSLVRVRAWQERYAHPTQETETQLQ